MQNVYTYILIISLTIGLTNCSAVLLNTTRSSFSSNNNLLLSTTRDPKIMYGFRTRDGEFGWQASLELLHPSLGFIGHWCGGVLIHEYWILSSAHCIHNDLFNLPLPALWTVVLGENNRKIETGYEQRIPVDKIVMHEKYRHFKNDLVLMKLSRAANISPRSKIRSITLPSTSHIHINPNYNNSYNNLVIKDSLLPQNDDDLFERNENYLRNLKPVSTKTLLKALDKINRNEVVKRENSNKLRMEIGNNNATRVNARHKRRNDKFLHRRPTNPEDYKLFMERDRVESINYFDCITAGWGKFSQSGDLSDILLKIDVPIHSIKRCEDTYSGFVTLHSSQHLCAGRLDGMGGSCIGDSGGGLQCKLQKNGPWILVGITSFGSGCAKEGYADVFTNVAYYRNWIDNVIQNN